VVTEQGKLQANVEVTVAVIDGLFKGKIKATEHFPPKPRPGDRRHQYPGLTIEGGAIIEGRCYFDPSEQVAAPLEYW